MSIKLLVNSEAGVGKTSLLRTLGNETFVVSRDAKNFTLPIPHMMVEKWYDMTTFLYGGKVKDANGTTVEVEGVAQKMHIYTDKMGKPPENVVFDAVSQIWMDVIEKASLKQNVFGSQGAEVTKELGLLVKFIHEFLELNGVTVILLNHIIKEKVDGEYTGRYLSFGSGKFLEKKGFFSTVNEAITLTANGQNRTVHIKDLDKLSRTTLPDVPEKYYLENIINPAKSRKLGEGEKYFSLKEHLDLLKAQANTTADFRI